MRWILRRVDSLVSALFAAVFAVAGSQLLEFIQQYKQRLGGHLAEARLAFRQTLDNNAIQGLDVAARQALAAPQSERVSHLTTAWNAIDGAGAWELPWKFFWRLDLSIAAATWKSFQPAIPVTFPSLAYAGAGLVLGWMLWELTKAAFAPPRRLRRA